MAYRVDLSAMAVPEWARRQRIQELSWSERHVWLTRRMAKLLAEEDRAAGGDPKVLAAECRRCERCGRTLLGMDAARRRELTESCRTGAQLRCGEMCSAEARRERK